MTTTVQADVERPELSSRSRWRNWRTWTSLRVLLPVAVVVAGGSVAYHFAAAPTAPTAYVVPQNPDFEAKWGVRFNQVDVIGDGGLVELGYTVLDVEKATQFQSDVKNPPIVHSDERDGAATTTSQMKAGHDLRAGTNFFLLYSNPHSSIRPGETVSVEYKGLWVKHLPVR